MEYIDVPGCGGASSIFCCVCGIAIEPNPANMCVGCLRSRVDITEGIPKQAIIHFCKGCERYLKPPSEWVTCALESRELMSLCLQKLKGLNRVKLIDAGFVWTEPHSKRIKVKLTVHGEVLGGAVLQQVFVVEFTVQNQFCEDCHRTEAQDFYKALVQVRQKCENKKTFYYLEQLILKHKAHEKTLGIKPIHEGLDFLYASENHAHKMVDFLQTTLPCRYQRSKKLISHDTHSNTYNYKFSFSVELVPLSKDSAVCLPKKLSAQLGGIQQICLVYRVTNSVHIISPATTQIAEVSAITYWRNPFGTICNPKQLTEYIVMDVELIKECNQKSFPGQGTISKKHGLADVWVVRAADLGKIKNATHTRSHLGHVLKPGDSVMGYALGDSNVNDSNFDKVDSSQVPDVILVKKFFGNKTIRRQRRNWKLKHLNEEYTNLHKETNDYHEFLDDLEEDSEYRQNVNIFRDPNSKEVMPVDEDEVDPSMPQITLGEMLDDITLEDNAQMEEESQN